MASPVKDLVGRRFGRLQVLWLVPRLRGIRPHWMCLCDCGKQKSIEQWGLVRGTTLSCGCLRRERTATLYKTNRRTAL